MSDARICSRCLCDATIPSVRFDENGMCNFCKSHDTLMQYYPQDEFARNQMLDELVGKIKRKGKGRKYDCIVGISGGCDYSYLLDFLVRQELKPLAVHWDNGWNTHIAN